MCIILQVKVREFLRHRGYLEQGVVISDESSGLLDTGGGLLKARGILLPGNRCWSIMWIFLPTLI